MPDRAGRQPRGSGGQGNRAVHPGRGHGGPAARPGGADRGGQRRRGRMIRLGSLAGYPFEGPRVLGGWTPPSTAAVYAIVYKPDPETKPENYVVIYVGHADDLTTERFPFNPPRAACWVKRAGDR